MTTSGTTLFSPSVEQCIVEAFDRIGIRPPELGVHQMLSAKRSCNLILSEMTIHGVNLWKVDQQTVPLVQGVSVYSSPSSTVDVLDAYVRQYSMNGAVNINLPAFSTQINSPSVGITWANNGLSVGNYLNIIIPVSIGGLILYGFYQVTSVTSTSTLTITASSNATSTVTAGGTVPVFTTTANSATISVLLNNHGLVAGGTFVVQISTAVGGTTLFGTYTVATITNANNFTFTAAYAAGSNASATENGGQAQLAGQQVDQQPVDRVIMPISRTDYSSLPNKYQQGFPTVYWFDRLINPAITIWQVPDGNGPYALYYYRAAQIQDANPQFSQNLDLPFRFYEAFCAQLAWHLARKWKPEMEMQRKQDATEAMAVAMADDRERVGFFLQPQLDSYYQ